MFYSIFAVTMLLKSNTCMLTSERTLRTSRHQCSEFLWHLEDLILLTMIHLAKDSAPSESQLIETYC